MKKIMSVIVAAVMLVSFLSVSTFAMTYNGHDNCDVEVNIKKADSTKVIKDGIIGNDEYERLSIDLGEDTTPLNINFAASSCWDYAVSLLGTMEYYFSWDDVHGFNFAVRCTPNANFFRQDGVQPTTDPPEDHFLAQLGFQVCLDPIPVRSAAGWCPLLYYCVAKNTTSGEYLKGHYGSDQLGNSHSYDPIAGQDFVINYPGDGTAVLEWSIPFAEFTSNATSGDEIYFSIATCNGIADHQLTDHDDDLANAIVAIGLGDYSYGTKCTWDVSTHCVGVLSDDAISSGNQNDPGDETSNNGGGEVTNPAANETQVVTEIETDENGETHIVTKVVAPENNNNNNNNTNGGKQTGDPMIIVAALSAISACGIVVFKKKH